MIFGAHVPVSGGYDKAADYAASVGCECMQVFSRSPRMWRSTPLDLEAVARFRLRRAELGLGPLFVHTAYLINLGSSGELRAKSVTTLADELARAAAFGADGVVTHIGTRACEDRAGCARAVADAVLAAYAEAGEAAAGVRLLLENTAGAGSSFGGEFADLAATLEALGDSIACGACVDTCHAHAHGTDLSTAEGWEAALDALDATVGISRLGLVHANDSMFACGARRDRHAWIGDGTIGTEGFFAMVCEPRLAGLPAVIELPGDPPGKDIENLRRLKDLRSRCPLQG